MKGKVLEKCKIGNEFIQYCSYSWWYKGRERRFNKHCLNYICRLISAKTNLQSTSKTMAVCNKILNKSDLWTLNVSFYWAVVVKDIDYISLIKYTRHCISVSIYEETPAVYFLYFLFIYLS